MEMSCENLMCTTLSSCALVAICASAHEYSVALVEAPCCSGSS